MKAILIVLLLASAAMAAPKPAVVTPKTNQTVTSRYVHRSSAGQVYRITVTTRHRGKTTAVSDHVLVVRKKGGFLVDGKKVKILNKR
jgi:hypothetical protein